jgi:hypothetical protein
MNNKIIQISNFDSIGDSLSAVNQNYNALDQLVSNIQFSAINYWIPMANYYEERKDFWKQQAKDVAKNIDNWRVGSTVFETNSSRWITPMVAWYPCLLEYEAIQKTPSLPIESFKNWLNSNYPVLASKNIPNYLDGQRCIVYAISYSQDTPTIQKYDLFDTTTCRTKDQTACASCSKSYRGRASCDNGDFDCNGTNNGKVCQSMKCYFIGENGKQTPTKTMSIHAAIEIDYENKYEATDLVVAVFVVKNCEWQFSSFLNVLGYKNL